jgi:hypothetical protein
VTISQIEFFECLSEMYWNWREQSHSLFEHLKHNKINTDIKQLRRGQIKRNLAKIQILRLQRNA